MTNPYIFYTDYQIDKYQKIFTKQRKPRSSGRWNNKRDPIFASEKMLFVSPAMINFAFVLRQYRRQNNLSQVEMARACSLMGKSQGIKFSFSEISSYENCVHVPTTPKFQVLMKTMGVDPQIIQ